MSKKDDKLQAEIWLDEPDQLNTVLRGLRERVQSLIESRAVQRSPRNKHMIEVTRDDCEFAAAELGPVRSVLNEYRRIALQSPLDIRLLIEVMDQLDVATDQEERLIEFALMEELLGNLNEFDRWTRFQVRQRATPLRSESLRTTIELLEDEVIVRTDLDGSVKLRGAASVPMFLAFWRAPGHRLGPQSFLDIDRGSTYTALERQSTRLCARLQDVLLEVVKSGEGFQLQRCRRG